MEKSTDTFAWTRKLECPTTICNDSVKKILHSGLVGLLWDDLAENIFTAEEAKTIRKNILLHHLKQGTSNKVIKCMKNLLELKSNRNCLMNQISKLEKEYEQQDFVVRQKVQKLRDISSKRSNIKARRDLLKMKHDQTCTQLRDHNSMRLVCQHLMPSTCKDLDPKILVEMSGVVTSLWTGANKREVWDMVSTNLNHIEVPTLWFHIYQNLTDDVDTLIKLSETMKSMNKDEKGINVGFARIYGQHISVVTNRLLSNVKASNYQQSVLEFIGKIEAVSNNSSDVSEWLALALEVCKLETEQKVLQEELEKIQGYLHESNAFALDLAELSSQIQDVDTEIVECVQDIQHSLNLLKSAPMFLMQIKEKINLELQKIAAMRADDHDYTILNNDLCDELDVFYDVLNINALRKVLLKGNVGIYRHTKSCFSEASIPITNFQISNITPYFPLIQAPIYSLLECYKNLISMLVYKKFDSLENEENLNSFQLPMITHKENNYNTIELLNLSKVVSTKTKAEMDEFNEILNVWINQTVQKAMSIIEKTVEDATFPEWRERYDLLSYVLQNST
ncbi:hypothetical protein ANTQUA_LOCUS8813 [Anthophora quadrimaculata]